jgi:hypothetical protein
MELSGNRSTLVVCSSSSTESDRSEMESNLLVESVSISRRAEVDDVVEAIVVVERVESSEVRDMVGNEEAE